MSALFAQFHFLRPLWLLALLLLPVLLWLWKRRGEASDPWRAAVDAHLLPHLLIDGATRRARAPQWLFACSFALAVLALAGPAFRQVPLALSRAESALVIAVDLSDRIRATDLKPDRLSRVRFKVADLLAARREGQTALIAYAGDAFVVAPLTDDAKSLGDLLASLSPETMPIGGQRADRAIARAQQLLHDAGFARGDLVLLTDAADERARDAATRAAEAGLRVSVLGVGSAAGAPIALPQGGFVQDEEGNVLLPRLDATALRALAAAGDGRYAELAIDTSDLVALDLIDPDVADGNLRNDERTRAEFRDEGPWLLLPLLPLAALAFRRGWLGAIVLGLAFGAAPPRAHAFEWSALWKRDDQRAYDALQSDQAERARQLARDPALRGSAAYRAEDYAQAQDAFSQAAGADADYNRGNALAKAQRYDEAIAAYDQALQQAPDMDDAQANRRAVQDWLERQKQRQQPQQSSDDSQQPKGEKGEPGEQDESQEQEGDPQQGEPSDSEQGQAQEREGENGESKSESDAEDAQQQQQQAQQEFAQQMQQALEQGEKPQDGEPVQAMDPREAEKQQAVEQWLRRVPDDPGGLLRRKFALEYQRRRREGETDR
jgi:Ca-activated chloride channel family protein